MLDDFALPADIDVALNEAAWWGAKIDVEQHRVALGFDLRTLSDDAGGSGRERLTLVLVDVHRLVASHRHARWDDDAASAVPCTEAELPEIVRSFGGRPVYGWEFFDTPDETWQRWAGRLSLDLRWLPGSAAHSLDLFQEGREGHLDLRAWFDRLDVYDMNRQPIPLEDFAAGGRRWWDALYAGDARTAGAGIYPLKPDDRDR